MTPHPPTGFIPYSKRNKKQQVFSDIHRRFSGRFAARSTGKVELPDLVILEDLELAALGELLARIWQQSGSCVGAGAGGAYGQSICADIVLRGDHEAPKMPCFLPTYGVGRELAGMNGPGDGSFGSSQSEAVQPEHFGMLPIDDKRLPQPEIVGGGGGRVKWIKYTEKIERKWSHPRVWPIPRGELEPEAKEYGIHDVSFIETEEELDQSIAQGFGTTVASSYGCQTPTPVIEDVLLGSWTTTWYHQMRVGGYWRHPKVGKIYKIDNQWFETIHGFCPTLEPRGITGSFWMKKTDMLKIMASRDGEVISHTNTGGFELRDPFKWGTHGWSYG